MINVKFLNQILMFLVEDTKYQKNVTYILNLKEKKNQIIKFYVFINLDVFEINLVFWKMLINYV